MTNQQRNSRRRSFPPYDESSKLSRRDQTLVRVEKLLSEQFIAPLQEEVQPEEDGAVDLVDLAEAVETAQLPPEARPQPRVLITKVQPAESPAQTPAPAAAPPVKKGRLSVVSVVLQAAILIFVLAWVFLLGILVGRGHLWQSGLGHDLVVWVEQKANWADKSGPEIVLKKDNQPDEVIPPADPTEGEQTAEPEAGQTPDEEPAEESADSGEADEPRDEMPVWDWPGWTPGDPLAPEPDLSAEADPAPAPASTPEEAPVADSQAADSPATDSPATDSPAQAADSPAPAPAAEEAEEESWPTAIEDDAALGPETEYQPPSDQDDFADYEAMLEPAEVPDATLTEATPLPPDMDGAPGTGKFTVQVAEAANAEEAQGQVSRLISQGFNAYYYDGGNGRFPVRVGPFATRQNADRAKVQLEDLDYDDLQVSSLGN